MTRLLLSPRARVIVLVFLAACIQSPILDRFQVAHAHPDLLLLLPVMGGLVAGPDDGAWIGFVSGFFADLALPTAFGLAALVFTLTGYLTGLAVQALIEGPWWIAPLTGAVGSALGVGLYVAIATATGQTIIATDPFWLATVLGVVSFANALLAIPVQLLLRLAYRPEIERQAA